MVRPPGWVTLTDAQRESEAAENSELSAEDDTYLLSGQRRFSRRFAAGPFLRDLILFYDRTLR